MRNQQDGYLTTYYDVYQTGTFSAETGKWTLSNRDTKLTVNKVNNCYASSSTSTRVIQYGVRLEDMGRRAFVKTRILNSVENPNPTYQKGTTKYGIVTSSSSSTYPNNGYQSGYYYVKTTSQ
ncbi:MAG: hypothetical protein HFJ55_01385 [Clostridia bacterium]|nr:hypothetical protein [Clostridia bacterium]